MEKFTSIESFKHIVQNTHKYYGGIGMPLPTHTFEGTVKLHGCFARDTPITMANGSQVNIEDIKCHDYILSYDFNKNEHLPKRVTQTWKSESEKSWIRLTFDNHTFIDCTEDHKIYTTNRGWVEAQHLTDDDVFVTDL